MTSAIMNVTDVVRSALKCGVVKAIATKQFFVVGSGPIYDALKHVQEKFNPDVYVEFGKAGWLYADSLCALDFSSVQIDQELLEFAMDEAHKNGYGIYFIAV